MPSNDSLIWTLVIFGLGVGLALTPCVFPMYPILSALLSAKGKSSTAQKPFTLSMAYVQGMAITYSHLRLSGRIGGTKIPSGIATSCRVSGSGDPVLCAQLIYVWPADLNCHRAGRRR